MFNPEYGMPYETDVNQYETEEERRRRLAQEAEAAMPVKQTITYDPVTGAQKVKIEGGASNLTNANPATPTVSGPVSPDDIYNRMIQAESGGRQFNAQGGVLTSPRGAMGAGQVMPATAMQPGYGVTNIFDMAQQRGVPVPSRDEAGARQLLGNESLNRDFGQSYFNAMQQRFPGQPDASVAAYNAGPGRVGQNMAANAGQLNAGQLPNETQAYIQKVMGRMPQATAQQPQPIIDDQGQMIGRETPEQMVAGAATNAPVDPNSIVQQPGMQQVSQPGVPAQALPEQAGPPTSLMSNAGWVERYNTAKDNFQMLADLSQDPNLTIGAKMEINGAMAKQKAFERSQAEALAKFQENPDQAMKDLSRDMRRDNKQGSWLKYLFYGFIDPNMAKNERLKLFPEEGATYKSVVNPSGQAGEIMFSRDGQAMRGRYADGSEMPQQDVISLAAGIGTGGVAKSYRLPNGTMVNQDKQGRLTMANTRQPFAGDTSTLLTEEQYKTVQDRANNAGQEAAKEQRARTPGDTVAIQQAFDQAKNMVLGPVTGMAGGTGQAPGTQQTVAQQPTGQQPVTQRPATQPTAGAQPWFGQPKASSAMVPGPNEGTEAFKSRLSIQADQAKFFNGAEPASSTTPVTRTGVSAHSVKAGEAEQIFRDMNKIIVDNPQIAGTGRVNNWFDFGLRMATGGFSQDPGKQEKDRAAIVKNLDPIGLKQFERFEGLAQRAANTVAKEVNPAGAFQESDAVRAAKQTFSNLKDLGPSTIIEGTRGYAEKNLKDKVFGEFVRNRPDISNIDQARTEFNQVFKPYEAQINGINEVRIKSVDKEMVTRFGPEWKQTYNQSIAQKNTTQQTAINNYLTAKSIESERRYPLPKIIDGKMQFENKDQQFAAKYGLDQYLAGRR